MKKINIEGILKELQDHGISYFVNRNWKIVFTGGDDEVRKFFQEELEKQPAELKALLILEHAKVNENLNEAIEERAAIREFNNVPPLPGDRLSAVLCNIT